MTSSFDDERSPGAVAPGWIVTFTDMVSVLVTFFVLLLTFSSREEDDAFPLPVSLLGPVGILEVEPGRSAVPPPEDDLVASVHDVLGSDFPHSRPQDELALDLSRMGQKRTPDHVEVDFSREPDGLVVRFDERTSFAPGSTEVNDHLANALGELGRVLEHYPFLVVVEGFTDAGFVPTSTHSTPEDLGCARALAAAKALCAASDLKPGSVQVAGVGSRRLRDVSDTALGRARNRRVEVRVLPATGVRLREGER